MNNYEFSDYHSILGTEILFHTHQSSSGVNEGGHGGISNTINENCPTIRAYRFESNPPHGVTEGFHNDNPVCHPQTTQSNLTEYFQEGLDSDNVCMVKGPWTDEEDRRLKELVEQFGQKSWKELSKRMLGRRGGQCRERWINHLRPDIKKDPNWSEAEETMLISAHKRLNNGWADIAKEIPGRSENSIKNHWYATRRKLDTKRNGYKRPRKKKNNKSTLLLDYMNGYYTKNISNNYEHPTSTPISISLDTRHTLPTIGTSHDPIILDDTIDPMNLRLSRIFQMPITRDQDDLFIQILEKFIQ